MGRFLVLEVLKKLLSRLSVILWACPPPSFKKVVPVCSSIFLPVGLFVCLCACLSLPRSARLPLCLLPLLRCRRSRVVRVSCSVLLSICHSSYFGASPTLPLSLCALSCQPPLPLGEPPVGMPCGSASRCSSLQSALSRT